MAVNQHFHHSGAVIMLPQPSQSLVIPELQLGEVLDGANHLAGVAVLVVPPQRHLAPSPCPSSKRSLYKASEANDRQKRLAMTSSRATTNQTITFSRKWLLYWVLKPYSLKRPNEQKNYRTTNKMDYFVPEFIVTHLFLAVKELTWAKIRILITSFEHLFLILGTTMIQLSLTSALSIIYKCSRLWEHRDEVEGKFWLDQESVKARGPASSRLF